MYWNPGGNAGVSAERSYGAKYSLEHQGKWTIRFTSDQLYYDQMIQWAREVMGIGPRKTIIPFIPVRLT